MLTATDSRGRLLLRAKENNMGWVRRHLRLRAQHASVAAFFAAIGVIGWQAANVCDPTHLGGPFATIPHSILLRADHVIE
jgi:hypothetical protein